MGFFVAKKQATGRVGLTTMPSSGFLILCIVGSKHLVTGHRQVPLPFKQGCPCCLTCAVMPLCGILPGLHVAAHACEQAGNQDDQEDIEEVERIRLVDGIEGKKKCAWESEDDSESPAQLWEKISEDEADCDIDQDDDSNRDDPLIQGAICKNRDDDTVQSDDAAKDEGEHECGECPHKLTWQQVCNCHPSSSV